MKNTQVKVRILFGKVMLTGAVGLLAVLATPSHATPPDGYTLSWSDEFNGAVNSQPSSSNWNYDLGTGSDGWGNWELQSYVNDVTHIHIISDSAATDGKALQIEATDSSGAYQSARINSSGKVQPEYGYIEARIKAPYGQGIWPAFWMLGNNMSTVGWPNCGEMDIMEMFGQTPGTNMASFHMGTESNPVNWTADYTLANNASFASGYHTFGLLWNSQGVTDYVDNVAYEYHPSTSSGWVFNRPFYFLINMAVGGTPPGSPNSSTVFPQYLDIDYVRVYQPAAQTGTTVTDYLNDWSFVSAKSANWELDTSNVADFDGDMSRATRTKDDTEYLEYTYPKISSFSAKIYTYNGPVTTVTFLVSTNNGSTWTAVPATYGNKTTNSTGWGYYTVKPTGALPSSVTNLKVQSSSGTGNAWDPEISSITITHG